MHYHKIESDLSAEKTQQVLEVLDQPGIVEALERVPIDRITITRLTDKRHPAWYDADTKSVWINSGRKLGLHFGAEFHAGVTWNMSRATTDKTESMRRSLIQEVAHHLEALLPLVMEAVETAWADPLRRPITGYARTRNEYFAESLVAYYVERDALFSHDPVGGTMVEQAIAVMRRDR